MKLSGDYPLQFPPEVVWHYLNDEQTLLKSIPGCQSLTRTSDTSFNAVVSVKLGPVSAKFKGDVELTDLDPPFGYTISGTGSGGIAGFAKGSARVRLTPVNGGTTLSYEVDAQIGGKLAQLGARLIDSTSRKLAMEFFENFGEQVGQHASAKVAASPRG